MTRGSTTLLHGRRAFLGALAALPAAGAAASRAQAQGGQAYLHQGRVDAATHAVIERGLVIDSIETFVRGAIGDVRLRTRDGREGWGQIAPYEPAVTVDILHRLVAPHALGKDPADLDAIVDRAVEVNYKYPWSFICRAVCGTKSRSQPSSGSSRLIVGGATWSLMAITLKIASTAPAAPSRWPVMDLVELTASL